MGETEKVRVSGELSRPTDSGPVLPTVNPEAIKSEPQRAAIPPAVYVIVWISLSSGVILFNKWILSTLDFHYPVILTTWHLTFATIMTQVMARTTTLLDGRKTIKMTGRVYLRAIVPIGIFFSLSLICGNLTYLYLSVAFIQMLKATTPVAVLLAGWTLGVEKPNMKLLFNVSFIVIGVIIASFGEIKFVLIGFLYQAAGILFEAIRLTMVQQLLSPDSGFKMDPLVSLYYFAPVCAAMNFMVALFWEIPQCSMAEVYRVGFYNLLANAMVAFCLNVSVVFLIGKTSSLVLTLCGVLKDILLVVASMIIWGTVVTPLQFFGYTIALGGLVYYKLGNEVKGHIGNASLAWADYGQRHPIMRKLVVFGAMSLTIFLLLGGLAPKYAPQYDPAAYLGGGKLSTGVNPS